MDIGSRIREERKAAGMTQGQLAEAIGVYTKDVSRWENGERTPGLASFRAICAALHASADDLLGLDESSENP